GPSATSSRSVVDRASSSLSPRTVRNRLGVESSRGVAPATTPGRPQTASWSTSAVWEVSRPCARSVATVSASDYSARASGAAPAGAQRAGGGIVVGCGSRAHRGQVSDSQLVDQGGLGGQQALGPFGRGRVVLRLLGEVLRSGAGEDHPVDLRGHVPGQGHQLVVDQNLPDLGAQLGV